MFFGINILLPTCILTIAVIIEHIHNLLFLFCFPQSFSGMCGGIIHLLTGHCYIAINAHIKKNL